MTTTLKLKSTDSLNYVTIDSEHTRDIDDALYVHKLDHGYSISIAIANPVDLVPIGGPDDEQAAVMGATK
jgi:exoribonuclease-2